MVEELLKYEALIKLLGATVTLFTALVKGLLWWLRPKEATSERSGSFKSRSSELVYIEGLMTERKRTAALQVMIEESAFRQLFGFGCVSVKFMDAVFAAIANDDLTRGDV